MKTELQLKMVNTRHVLMTMADAKTRQPQNLLWSTERHSFLNDISLIS